MDEERNGAATWLWALLIVAFIAAVVFAILWVRRGDEVQRLADAARSAKSAADNTIQRLERDADSARREIETGRRKTAELETRMRDDQRRAAESAQQLERRLRDEISSYSLRLNEASTSLDALRLSAEQTKSEHADSLAANKTLSTRLSSAQRQLGAALTHRDTALKLEQELAGARETIDSLKAKVGDLEAHANTIGNELTTANEELRKAERERQTIPALRSELDRAKAQLAEKTADEEKHAQIVRDLTQRLTRFQTDEKELRASVASLEGRLAAAGRELAEHKARLAQLEAAGRPAGDGDAETLRRQIENIRGEAEAAQKRAEQTRADAQGEVDKLAGRLSETNKTMGRLRARIAELQTERDRLIRDQGTAGQRAAAERDALRQSLADAKRLAASLEEKIGDVEANRNSLRKELDSAAADLRAVEKDRDDLRAFLNRAANDLIRTGKEREDLRQALDKVTADLLKIGRERDDLRKTLDRTTADLRKAGQERDTLRKSLGDIRDKADRTARDLNQRLKAAEETLERSKTEARDAALPVARPAPAEPGRDRTAVTQAAPRHVIVGDPGRSVSRILQAMPGGRCYLVAGGSKQRMKPGMVFDVHRPVRGVQCFVGRVRVVMTDEEHSVVESAPIPADAKICPVTCRAAVGPDMVVSPWAVSYDGRPVPLLRAADLGVGREMPIVGDLLDNPYYNPERGLVFGVSPELVGNPGVTAVIAALGGVAYPMEDAMAADFLVGLRLPENADPTALPRWVTPAGIASYLSSAPAGVSVR